MGFLCGFPTLNMRDTQVLLGRWQSSCKQGWGKYTTGDWCQHGNTHSSGVNLLCYHMPSFPTHHYPSLTFVLESSVWHTSAVSTLEVDGQTCTLLLMCIPAGLPHTLSFFISFPVPAFSSPEAAFPCLPPPPHPLEVNAHQWQGSSRLFWLAQLNELVL